MIGIGMGIGQMQRGAAGYDPSVRRNLLVYTEFDGAVSGTPGTAPTGWVFNVSTGTLTALGSGVLRFSGTAARHIISRNVAIGAGEIQTWALTVDENPDGLSLNKIFSIISPPAGLVSVAKVNGVEVVASTYVPLAGERITYTLTNDVTAGTPTFRIGLGALANVTGTVAISEPQAELGSVATPYQAIPDTTWPV